MRVTPSSPVTSSRVSAITFWRRRCTSVPIRPDTGARAASAGPRTVARRKSTGTICMARRIQNISATGDTVPCRAKRPAVPITTHFVPSPIMSGAETGVSSTLPWDSFE